MDLRKLAFSVDFLGDEGLIKKSDKAMDDLKKTIGQTTKGAKTLEKQMGKATDTKTVRKLDKETRSLRNRFEDTARGISTNIRYAKGEVDELGRAVKDGVDTEPVSRFSAAFIDAGKSISEAGKIASEKLKEIQQKGEKAGKSLTKKLTLPLVGVATAGTKMALDVDHGIRKVTTLADRDILPVDKIRSEVRAISDASGIAQTEIAESVYGALSAGVESDKVMDFVRSGIDLTRAGFTDMETAIDATTTVLNAYGDDAYEVSKIHDIFVQTQDKGKISVDELGKSIGRVIPTASSLGVNMDQLGTGYAILTAKGQNAQLATTNLNAMYAELGATGSKTDEALREMAGKSFAQLTKEGKSTGEVLGMLEEYADKNNLSLKDMFGSMNAGSAAVTLLGDGVKGYNSMLAEMDNATGKTAENAAKMEDGWFKIERAMTQVKNTLIEVGGTIAPYVEKAADRVSEAVTWFNELDDGTKSNIMRFAGLAAVIGPVILGASKLIGVVGGAIKIGSTLVGGIFTIIGALGGPLTLGIGAAIGLGVALYKNWGTIKDKAKELRDSIVERWDNLKTKTAEVWEGMKDNVTRQLDRIKDGWEKTKDFFKNPIKGVVNIGRNIRDRVTGNKDGSHKTGLARVPFDGYLAELHKGEEVLTADDPRNINNYQTTSSDITTNQPVISYNPTFNIEISGNATEEEAEDMINQIDDRTRKMFEKMFYELGLQLS